MKLINARGLSCPEPVIQARRAVSTMSAGDQIEILVDTGAARDNVLRAVRSLGCVAECAGHEGGFRIKAAKK